MEICMVTYILFWLTLCIYVYASCMQIINKLLFQIFKFFFKLNFKLKNHSNYGIFQHPKFFIEGWNIVISSISLILYKLYMKLDYSCPFGR